MIVDQVNPRRHTGPGPHRPARARPRSERLIGWEEKAVLNRRSKSSIGNWSVWVAASCPAEFDEFGAVILARDAEEVW